MEENNKNPVEQYVEILEVKVKTGKATVDDFKFAFAELQKAKLKVQQLLEYKTLNNNDTNNDYYSLYKKISGENFSDLVDKLNQLGYSLGSNKKFNEAISNNGYRIMEQTRMAKKDVVFYSLLRIFISTKLSFSEHLLMAFKQDDKEIFKILIFSFLSGALNNNLNDNN